jgi:hypothetical protein
MNLVWFLIVVLKYVLSLTRLRRIYYLVSSTCVTLVNSIISGLGKLWFSVQLRSLIKHLSDFLVLISSWLYNDAASIDDGTINECGTVGGVKKKFTLTLKYTEHCLQLRMVSSGTLLSSFRQLHADFSPQDLGLGSVRFRAGFVVDEVPL